MKKTTVLAGAAALFGDVAVFNMLFFTFAWLQKGELMQPGVSLWASCLLLLYLGNVLFLRKPRAVPALAGLNLFAFGGMTALVFLGSAVLHGFLPVAFAVLFFGITSLRALSFALHPMTVSRMLTTLNAHLIAICFYALAQEGGGLPAAYNGILLAALLAEVTALAFLRTFGDGRNVLCASRWQGVFLLAGMFALLGLLLTLFFSLLSASARSAASALVTYVGAAVKAALHGAMRLLAWLISLIPVGNTEEFLPPPAFAPVGGQETEALGELSLHPAVLLVIGCVAAALLLGLAAYLLFRLRRVKLSAHTAGGVTVLTFSPRFLAGLKRRFSARLAALRFRLKALYYRNTAPGVLLALERRGRRHHLPRRGGETHGAFLLRLSGQPPFDAGDLPALLLRLKEDLDARYYAPGGRCSKDALSRRELRSIRACLRTGGRKQKQKHTETGEHA